MHRKLRISLALNILLAIIIFVAGAAISGIIGNTGYLFFVSLWDLLVRSIQASLISWIIVLTLLLTCLFLLFHSRTLNRALTTVNHLNELDDSLLRLLASWNPAKSNGNQLRIILTELLRNARRGFSGQVHRAFLLIPDSTGEYLQIGAHIGIPAETIERTKFYIGSDSSKANMRGVAGEAFLTQKIIVSHMFRENEVWRSDADSYIKFTLTGSPSYRSFVCIPIIGLSFDSIDKLNIITLGVACFDSLERSLFDSSLSKVLLEAIARRISSALMISKRLEQITKTNMLKD